VKVLYTVHVVKVVRRWLPSRKSAALEGLAAEVFGTQKFDCFRTRVGIVGTRWDDERPIIFKTHADQAYTGAATFEPGFGATIGDAFADVGVPSSQVVRAIENILNGDSCVAATEDGWP
jgi:hypothetical protein